ncbi:hypothetical protein AALA00_03905 [Lachnospiraceae bacterium 46-15]
MAAEKNALAIFDDGRAFQFLSGWIEIFYADSSSNLCYSKKQNRQNV